MLNQYCSVGIDDKNLGIKVWLDLAPNLSKFVTRGRSSVDLNE